MANMLIVLPLITIACIAGFYQLFTISSINFTKTQDIPTGIPNSGQSYTNIPNGDPYYQQPLIGGYDSAENNAIMSVEMTTGIIALIIGCTSVAVVAGVKLFGSGLSETSVRIIYRATLYYGLWGVFSALSYPFFLAFPLFLGGFGWFMLTLIYSLGYFEAV